MAAGEDEPSADIAALPSFSSPPGFPVNLSARMTQPENTSISAGDKLVLSSPDSASSLKDFLLWSGVIVLIVLTAYSPALHGKFLWDDDRHIEQNRGLRDAAGLQNIWTGHWQYLLASDEERSNLRVFTPQYYPLTHTSFWLEYQLSGAQPGEINTTIFHVVNAILHAACAILLWFILRELAVPGAWVAAAIFAVHPMEAESVAWMSERKNVLAGVFFFGAILAYLRSLRTETLDGTGKRDMTLYVLSFGLFICAILSKTVACSMPAVVLLLIWWKRGKLTMRDVLYTLPFFVVGFGMAMLTSWIERKLVGASGDDWNLQYTQRILIAGRAVWFYAGKIVWPTNLTFIYPRWVVDPSQPWQWIFPAGVAAVLAALFALRNRIGRGPVTAALIFVGVLTPALGFFNFFPMRYSFVADHFQYLAGPALIALIVAIVWNLTRKISENVPPVPYVLAGGVLVVLLVLTMLRTPVYADSFSLWRDTSARNPGSPMTNYNYGVALVLSVEDLPLDLANERPALFDQSMPYFARAVELDPKHDRAWNAWGQALLERERPQEALPKFDRALEVKSDNIDALMGRGLAFLNMKQPDDALAAYQKALAAAEAQRKFGPRIKEKAGLIYRYLGQSLEQKGDLEGAAKHYDRAAKISPEAANIQDEYGMLLAKMGNRTAAAEHFYAAIQARPAAIDPRLHLARLMIEVGNLNGAQQQLVAAARINPTYPPLMGAAKLFDAAMRVREAAATQPSTTQSAEKSATQAATQPALPGPLPVKH